MKLSSTGLATTFCQLCILRTNVWTFLLGQFKLQECINTGYKNLHAAWAITLCFWDKLWEKPNIIKIRSVFNLTVMFHIMFLPLPPDYSSNWSSCTYPCSTMFPFPHPLPHPLSVLHMQHGCWFPPTHHDAHLSNVLRACQIFIPFCSGCCWAGKTVWWLFWCICCLSRRKTSVQVALRFCCCQAWAEGGRAELLWPLLSEDAVQSFSWFTPIPFRSLYQTENLDEVN